MNAWKGNVFNLQACNTSFASCIYILRFVYAVRGL